MSYLKKIWVSIIFGKLSCHTLCFFAASFNFFSFATVIDFSILVKFLLFIMNSYMNAEMTDMHLMYGLAEDNSKEVPEYSTTSL